MTCQLNTFATVSGCDDIKTYLFPLECQAPTVSTNPCDNEGEGDGWQDVSWGWGDSEVQGSSHEAWLQESLFAISSTGEVAVAINKNRAVFLASKWDSQESTDVKTKFQSVWQGNVNQNRGEVATVVVCLPLASQRKTSEGQPDWTCVLIGFSSGYVRMYTESGSLLLSQQFHQEPVLNIRVHTYHLPRHSADTEYFDELCILFPRAVVVLDGFALYQTLRACRSQLARAQAVGSESLESLPLAYKKWGFQRQAIVRDCVSVGPITPCSFDHLLTASMLDGPSARPKPSMPQSSLFITTGNGPYIGFFYAIDGSANLVLAEVASAVASRLKSALVSAASGFMPFSWNSRKEENKEQHQEPASPLYCRFGLPDQRREGESMCLSPSRRYCGVTDEFGRVSLLDTCTGVVLRMWKGYRSAEMGWVESFERGSKRRALFLVIHAPRRDLLEVWHAPSGPRVAAFNVGKGGRLLNLNYGMLGLNNVTARHRAPNLSCVFIDGQGAIRSIQVPFHCALSERNSKRLADLELYRQMKTAVKEGNEDNVRNCLEGMNTAAVRRQALCSLLGNPSASLEMCVSAVEILLDISPQQEDLLGVEGKLLVNQCQQYEHLLSFYSKMVDRRKQQSAPTTPQDHWQDLKTALRLTDGESKELSRCKCLWEAVLGKEQKGVTFLSELPKPAHFLHCFSNPQRLHPPKDEHILMELGELVFGSGVDSGWRNCVVDSGIPALQLIQLLILHLLASPPQAPSSFHLMTIFSTFVALFSLAGTVEPDFRDWIREKLRQSDNPLLALLLAYIVRSALVSHDEKYMSGSGKDSACGGEEDEDENPEDEEGSGEWEAMSAEGITWNILLHQLEGVALLGICLSWKNPEPVTELPDVPPYHLTISLHQLLPSGRGSVSEVVAKLAIANKIPETVLLTSDEESDTGDSISYSQLGPLDLLRCIRRKFPLSLEPEVLVTNVCWEYAVLWNRDLDNISLLESSIRCFKAINTAHLQHGVGMLLWSTWVRSPVESTARLLNKVGRLPKERQCKREAGITDQNITKLLITSAQLIDCLMQSHVIREVEKRPSYETEGLWDGEDGGRRAPLTELCLSVAVANYDLLHLQHQLLSVMAMMTIFQLRSVNPLQLFDEKHSGGLFKELSANAVVPGWESSSTSVRNKQMEFLLRMITAAVKRLPDNLPPMTLLAQQTDGDDARSVSQWVGHCLSLAHQWELNVDNLRRHYVCELYASGHDMLAEENIGTVTEVAMLGSQLLHLAGQRVHYSLSRISGSSGDMLEGIVQLPPVLSSWILGLDTSSVVAQEGDVEVRGTESLLSRVLNLLPENHSQYHLALTLLELLQNQSLPFC